METEIFHPDFRQLALRAEIGEWQRRIVSSDHEQVQWLRWVNQQLAEQVVYRRLVDALIIVEHQGQRLL